MRRVARAACSTKVRRWTSAGVSSPHDSKDHRITKTYFELGSLVRVRGNLCLSASRRKRTGKEVEGVVAGEFDNAALPSRAVLDGGVRSADRGF
jgi:hypothetical protein